MPSIRPADLTRASRVTAEAREIRDFEQRLETLLRVVLNCRSWRYSLSIRPRPLDICSWILRLDESAEVRSRDCRNDVRASTLKSAIEIPRMAEVTSCVHGTTNGAKTSFKDDHVVDLVSRGRNIRSVHIIKVVTKKKEKEKKGKSSPKRQNSGDLEIQLRFIKRFKMQ